MKSFRKGSVEVFLRTPPGKGGQFLGLVSSHVNAGFLLGQSNGHAVGIIEERTPWVCSRQIAGLPGLSSESQAGNQEMGQQQGDGKKTTQHDGYRLRRLGQIMSLPQRGKQREKGLSFDG
ncbi:MAG: hypothetical protein K1Y36_30800 [Blastocatellia bacterium]|nr:hypothetical protein [Blastocatellia bacterium]